MGTDESLRLASSLAAEKRWAEAEAAYRRGLAANPDHPDALGGLAVCLLMGGDAAGAVASLRRAVRVAPDRANLWTALAEAQKRLGERKHALKSYEQALRLSPSDWRVATNAGSVAFECDSVDEAITLTRRALQLRPNDPTAMRNLASMVAKSGDPALALEVAESLARLPEIEPVLTRATQHHLLGNALVMCERYAEGLGHLRTAIEAAGESAERADLLHSFALAQLAAGDLESGLNGLSARLSLPGYVGGAIPPAVGRAWQGEEVAGKTVLVFAEQGAGDTFLFARYLPELVSRGARVIVWVAKGLGSALRGQLGAEVAEKPAEIPHHDYWVGMLDLPARLGCVRAPLTWKGAYLRADETRVVRFRKRLRGLAKGRRVVGVCWSGNPEQPVNRRRSLPAGLIAELRQRSEKAAGGDDLFLVSLQKQVPDGNRPGRGVFDADLMGEVSDFADTAAMLAAVDQVITTDTSVAHLAGAMGLGAWVLLHSPGPYWVFGDRGETTAWYPTLRLFRQPKYGEWGPVVAQIRRQLAGRSPA